MKFVFSLLTVFVSAALMAVTPVNNPEKLINKFEASSATIDAELSNLHTANTAVIDNNLSFDELAASHATLVEDANLSSNLKDGIFEKASDSPLGIPGFWWGFCLGLIGLLIIYIAMDDGADRKSQVKNGVWGCLISAAVSILLQVLVLAS